MRVRVGHTSMKYANTDSQHTHDIEKIFAHAVERRWAWVTGTEAGFGSGNTAEELVRVARKNNYRPWVPHEQGATAEARANSCWIAVREDLIDGGWEKGFDPAIPGSHKLYADLNIDATKPSWGPRGLVHVSFKSNILGRVNIGAAHYLPGGKDPNNAIIHEKINLWELNNKLAKVVGDWARRVGKGSALAFYAGDQNMNDAKNNEPQGDTFFGEPLTSLADELKKWQSTGFGAIDVIASYNADKRVVGQNFIVLDDSEFFLHNDHFVLEGTFDIKPL